ncbi:MAG: NADH-quinone oxidoreductase subunit A [Candidatus Bathyarchaeia archaeon]
MTIYLEGYLAFWIFTFIFIAFLGSAIFVAWLFGPIKPNPIKQSIYECGQAPFGRASGFRITGIVRYFGYAVVFFALDAFSWVVLTAAMSIPFSLETIAVVSVYTLVVLVGIGYFLAELRTLVR